ncbi:hypothetical protein C8R44DRAFT_866590 [Mycena epipterygia]|nr:hypothetical protein C8R44DRAFT_866590 [Mycena epipterygia]
MPDPISATTTVITLATFIKDLLDLGQSIKRSIEKVGDNKRRIHDLTEDILRTLVSLAELLSGRENTFKAPQLLSALGDLKADMLYVLAVTRQVAPKRGSGLRGLRSQFKNWLRREDIEVEIGNLKEHINKCFIQFTVFSASRIEYTTLRVEQAVIVNNVENEVKLRRLEGLMARVLVETQFGKNFVQETANIIASDPAHQTLESKYLSAQAMRVVDLLAALTATHSLNLENSLWDPSKPMEIRFLEPASSVHVLHTVLDMVLQLQDNEEQFAAEDIADDLLNLGSYLSMLGMYWEATASDVLTVQFLRCLASGEAFAGVTPRLVFSLYNLSKRYQDQRRYDLALQASQQSLGLCRLLSEVAPDANNCAAFLSVLVGHSHNLCMTGQLLEAISTAQQAVAICRPILAQLFASYPFDSGFQRLSPEQTWIAVKCCEAFFALAQALSFAGHHQEAHRASKEGLETVLRFRGSMRPPSRSKRDMVFDQLCKMAEEGTLSLSTLGEIVILYRNLSHIYRKEFTLPFLSVLYAHTHLHCRKSSLGSGALVLSAQYLRVPLELDSPSAPVHPSDALIFMSEDYPRAGETMEDAIRSFYASTSSPEDVCPISPLVHDFFVQDFDLAQTLLRRVVESLMADRRSIQASRTLAFTVVKISDTLSSVSRSQQSILLEIITELIAHFRTIIESPRASQKYTDYFVYALWWYCWALWSPGRLGEALAITHEAIHNIRSSSEEDKDAINAEMDDWLLDQAFILFDMGQISEANRVLDTLDSVNGDGGDQECFYSLVRSHTLRQMGRHKEALLVLADADQIQGTERYIVAAEIAAINLDLGRFQVAIDRADKVVAACRISMAGAIIPAQTEIYKPVLAYALLTLSNCFAAVGRHEEGLVAIREAATLLLALKQPLTNWPPVVRFQELTASALHALSMRLITARNMGAGLSKAEEATESYRELVSLAPRHLPSLARSLQNLASILWDVGRQDESITICQEAVEIARRISESDPYSLPSLPKSLEQLARNQFAETPAFLAAGQSGKIASDISASGRDTRLPENLRNGTTALQVPQQWHCQNSPESENWPGATVDVKAANQLERMHFKTLGEVYIQAKMNFPPRVGFLCWILMGFSFGFLLSRLV